MLRILIAEDDRFVRHLLRNFLTNAGHAVFVACNGQEACEIANEHEIDLALMDMNMPRVDGWTATRQIKDRIDCRIQVIAISAYGLPSDQARAAAAGCSRFLTKPIEIDMLAQAIAEVIEIRARQESP
jgi:CheY-like chemotaxis protein